MEKIYISKNYFGKNTAESKAKIDCEKIISLMGYCNKGLPLTTFQNHKISSILTIISSIIGRLRMPHDGIVVLQYPKSTIKEEIRIAKKRQNKVIIIVHDLETLRGFGASHDENLSWAIEADVLIVHTENMANYIKNIFPNKSVIILGIFDYLCNLKPYKVPEDTNFRIAFAGNLTKSDFLTEFEPKHTIINLFGIKKDEQQFHKNMKYKGVFPPENLAEHLNAHFGLVWDGDSNGNGKGGDYLRYISPHKLSMYLSAGLPVIIKEGTGMSNFILENNLGITISNLSDIDAVLSNLSKADYSVMLTNVSKMQSYICSGYFLKRAIKRAEEIIC